MLSYNLALALTAFSVSAAGQTVGDVPISKECLPAALAAFDKLSQCAVKVSGKGKHTPFTEAMLGDKNVVQGLFFRTFEQGCGNEQMGCVKGYFKDIWAAKDHGGCLQLLPFEIDMDIVDTHPFEVQANEGMELLSTFCLRDEKNENCGQAFDPIDDAIVLGDMEVVCKKLANMGCCRSTFYAYAKECLDEVEEEDDDSAVTGVVEAIDALKEMCLGLDWGAKTHCKPVNGNSGDFCVDHTVKIFTDAEIRKAKSETKGVEGSKTKGAEGSKMASSASSWGRGLATIFLSLAAVLVSAAF